MNCHHQPLCDEFGGNRSAFRKWDLPKCGTAGSSELRCKVELFKCPENLEPASISMLRPIISTPLGEVLLSVSIDKIKIEVSEATQKPQSRNGLYHVGWHRDDYDLELLIGRPILHLPAGLSVQDCVSGIWRLKANTYQQDLLFTAEWSPGYSWQEGSPDSGEGLYAKTWRGENITVSVGTEDNEAFAYRAFHNVLLPSHLENYFKQDFFNDPIHYNLQETGLPVPITSLLAGEVCQVHFSVAWSNGSPDDASTWYAVSCQPSDILDGCGCV